ncbi:MAG TPA: Holliday junction branch migration protein RuvA [Ruminococcaceae bacterium]|jgi:Holliday junction DNA helicase RuvA|nr:Holliday junction branch migration protein RuvA [Oscillospiraceae bacterium]HCO36793.1 Holliday junction branch migration protein RuvA [Oscillospiraceae bacterium]
MIYNVRGTLTYTDINYAVVECGGVGFKCFVSMTTLKELPPLGKEANLYTYLAVREDAMDLFGFATQQELDAFKLLITVSGVGPKAAMAVLSVLPPDRLSIAVSSGDVKSIQSAQGVGKKTAERIVLELKDKMLGIAPSNAAAVQSIQAVASNSDAQEAVEVLVSLGFNQSDAATVVGAMDKGLSVDDMIRKGLKQLSSQL